MRHGIPRRRRWKDERGAALVEMALIAPLFIFLLLGLVAFGLVLALKQSVTQSAEEGARAAIGVFPLAEDDVADVEREQRAFDAAAKGLEWLGPKCCDSGNDRIVVTNPGAPLLVTPRVVADCAGPGLHCMEVVVTYPYDDAPLVPIPRSIPPFNFVFPDDIVSEATVQLS